MKTIVFDDIQVKYIPADGRLPEPFRRHIAVNQIWK